ncbi:hypothetical protein [Microcella humidisoli]|uniref:Uncharacterized protein n=1 Tax=Microcella humidisoli TaxID=2963406 RepID=A0ABY5FUX2_9MICO|nr:hypothetical protein [Microcella humidisoli]UTT62093.1 hypothetical protein NNL39_10505 [Microcella humidisoli]
MPFAPSIVSVITAPGWIGVALLLVLVTALALLAPATGRPRLVVPAIIVVGVGALALALGFDARPVGLAASILPLCLVAVAIIAGGPVVTLVLAAATRDGAPSGEHGGIIVPVAGAAPATARTTQPTREVLRGGTTIGYLERAVVVAAVLLGRWELVGALIAIKGLGRFRDLDAGAATERFIIGTLVSTLWAGVCAALIVLA